MIHIIYFENGLPYGLRGDAVQLRGDFAGEQAEQVVLEAEI